MKSVLFLAMLFGSSVFGCAAFQGSPSKVDQIVDQVKCVAEAVKPYEQYFTAELMKKVLAGEIDPVEYLKSLDISAADLVVLGQDLKVCFQK